MENIIKLEAWLESRIKEEGDKREKSNDIMVKTSHGGKKKAFNDVLEFIKQHPLT